MKRFHVREQLLAGLVVALAITPFAHAQVSGSLWEGWTADTVLGGPPATTPDVTFTSNQIDFGDAGYGFPTPYTIGGFLNGNAAGGVPSGTAPTTVTVLTGAGELGNTDDNTYVQLTGTIYLNAGDNDFGVGHDDGVVISIAGIGTVLSAPGPTAFDLSPFTITAPTAGDYTYTVDYNECCGAPAALEWAYPSGKPIGTAPDATSTLPLIGTGLAMLGAFARRFRR
jgi:hypothetical protein